MGDWKFWRWGREYREEIATLRQQVILATNESARWRVQAEKAEFEDVKLAEFRYKSLAAKLDRLHYDFKDLLHALGRE